MFVSILQRFSLSVLPCAAEPLQSRADQNTRKAESGGQPSQKLAQKVKHCIAVAFEFLATGRRQTNQDIWHQLGSDCPTAVWPESRRRDPRAIPKLLPRGDTL